MGLFKKKVKSQEDYYLASQWTLMGRKLKKHKLARLSMVILGILYFSALFGNLLPVELDLRLLLLFCMLLSLEMLLLKRSRVLKKS